MYIKHWDEHNGREGESARDLGAGEGGRRSWHDYLTLENSLSGSGRSPVNLDWIPFQAGFALEDRMR